MHGQTAIRMRGLAALAAAALLLSVVGPAAGASIEERLAKCPSAQIPVRPGVPGGGVTLPLDKIKALAVDYEKVAGKAEEVAEYLRQNFRR